MPAWAVTSVNSIGPEGRGGVGLVNGVGVWLAPSGEAAAGAVDVGCLQAENKRNETSTRQKMFELSRISDGVPPDESAYLDENKDHAKIFPRFS